MPNFNKVYLMGNLTRDPELRATPSGTAVCQFGLAVNRVYNNSNGERQEETTFVDVEAWGRQAETVSKYVSKGHPLFVEGRLKLDSWENKEGEKRSKMKVVLENMQLISQKGEGGGGNFNPSQSVPQQRSDSGAAAPAPPAASQKSEDIEEDIPF